MATWSRIRGQHSGKTGAFVRACAAYCFITIPSLANAATRMKLYLLSGCVALINNCLGQGDACMKAAIKELLDVAASQDMENAGQMAEVIRSSVATLSSTLIATPDPPDASPPLYLLRGLTNAVRSYQWPKDTDLRVSLSLALIHAISASVQDTLPYHFHAVEGNDSLYGGDPSVQHEAEELCTSLLQDILTHIQSLTGVSEKRIGPLSLNTLWCIITWGDLNDVQMMNMAVFMWSFIIKHNRPQVITQTRDWITKRSTWLKNGQLEQFARHINSSR
ncbi:hypothetical protein SK128_016845 [Halocaridina rubra]|uniref:Uncharacterized protein n=1 Tax=Halocaridina rubra TaxID=373956 RepID=A0AAN8XHL8_HALRR